MKSTIAVFAALLLATTLSSTAWAQSNAEVRRVILVDGTVVVGTVVDENADPVVVVTRDGIEQRIPRSRIEKIGPALAGGIYRLDPTRTRLVFTPTGRTLGRSGTIRVGTTFYVLPTATFAVTDRVDVTGAGIFLGGGALLVGGAKAQLLDTDMVDAAVGFTVGAPLGSEDVDGLLITTPYAVATLGSELRSVTVGVSGLFGGDVSSGDFELADAAILNLGGEFQLSNRLKVLGEAIVPIVEGDGAGAVFAPGLRVFGDTWSFDLYGIYTTDDGPRLAPLINFSIAF